MRVVAGCAQIATPTAIDRQGLVTAAKEVAEEFVPSPVAATVSKIRPPPRRKSHLKKPQNTEAFGDHLAPQEEQRKGTFRNEIICEL